jgi:hypothetical protein
VSGTLTDDRLSTGIYPKTSIVNSSLLDLRPGSLITANVGQYISQSLTGANALVTGNVINSGSVPVTVISSNGFNTSFGNLSLGGVELVKASFISGTWSNVGIIPAAVVTTPTVVVDRTAPELFTGDQIQYVQQDGASSVWRRGSVTNETTVRLTGNTRINGTPGQYLTQAISGANATISNISPTTGTISIGGNTLIGSMLLRGIVVRANIGDVITQVSSSGNATVRSNTTFSDNIALTFNSGQFTIGTTSGNLRINGNEFDASPIGIVSGPNPQIIRANIGDVITQTVSGATATVIENQPGGQSVLATLNSGTFTLGQGNLSLNGGNLLVYPTAVSTVTDITATYNTAFPFKFTTTTAASFANISGTNTQAIFSSVISVGITPGALSTQGVIGFDEGRYDQGTLSLPQGLFIDPDSGWITGVLPNQTVNKTTYDFNVLVYKRDYVGYAVDQQYTLTILGDLTNTIDWLTPSNLGTIQNGDVSDLFVRAISSKGKNLFYSLTPGAYLNLPQGLKLLSNGIISGRVSFEISSLDQGQTPIDSGTTTFDNTYKFSITAYDYDRIISATREFYVTVLQRNIIPYENLYLKALLSPEQKSQFLSIVDDREIFPYNLIIATKIHTTDCHLILNHYSCQD